MPFRGDRRGPILPNSAVSSPLPVRLQQIWASPPPSPQTPAIRFGNLAWELPCVAEFIGVTHPRSHCREALNCVGNGNRQRLRLVVNDCRQSRPRGTAGRPTEINEKARGQCPGRAIKALRNGFRCLSGALFWLHETLLKN